MAVTICGVGVMLARGRSLGYVHAFLEAVRIRGVYCDKFRPSAVTINN